MTVDGKPQRERLLFAACVYLGLFGPVALSCGSGVMREDEGYRHFFSKKRIIFV
jgi:hypothetical protein